MEHVAAKYIARNCPRCDGYLGVALGKQRRNARVQAINGHCAHCGYRLAWLLFRGRQVTEQRSRAVVITSGK
jgi:hypothetical protein